METGFESREIPLENPLTGEVKTRMQWAVHLGLTYSGFTCRVAKFRGNPDLIFGSRKRLKDVKYNLWLGRKREVRYVGKNDDMTPPITPMEPCDRRACKPITKTFERWGFCLTRDAVCKNYSLCSAFRLDHERQRSCYRADRSCYEPERYSSGPGLSSSCNERQLTSGNESTVWMRR